MLLEFIFKNSYSYKEETYFSMEAAKNTRYKNEFRKKNNHRILKSSLILGPNASGKSNMMKSLRTFRNMIIKEDKAKNPYPSFAKNTLPIKYEVTILIEKKVYKYFVEYNKDRILEEKLDVEKKGSFTTYFLRKKDKYIIIPEELKLLTSKTRADNLFLNTAKTFNDKHCLNVFRWFRLNLIFIDRDMPALLSILYNKQKDKSYKNKLLTFLKASDLNIYDFEVLEININIPTELRPIYNSSNQFKEYNMTLRHHEFDNDGKIIGDYSLALEEESDGTKKLISLAIIVLAFETNTIFIDEFDDSFHPELSKALINLFNSKASTNQFILTTHELTLMDAGFKKEQIYFSEKINNNESNLYSIYDFSSEENRQDYSYVKRYKNGLFGAVPEILIGKLQEVLNDE